MKDKIFSGEKGFESFAEYVGLTQLEKKRYKKKLTESYMPFLCTHYYADLIKSNKGAEREQLTHIVLPPDGESGFVGRFDPYGNKHYAQESQMFLQHKYTKTLLVHFVDVCLANCQFCYKVNEIRVEHSSKGSMVKKIDDAVVYTERHPEINNILFTGGDPAAVKNDILISSISRLIQQPNIRMVRFATKALAFEPRRFLDAELLTFFAEINEVENKQVSIVVQFNHPAEFSPVARQALRELLLRGVQLRGQPAIIKGVNDDVQTLIDLQRAFIDNGIIPYYLTTFMPVRGVEQYALTLHEVYSKVSTAKKYLNGFEKKAVLLTSHDFGKFEICGFLPNVRYPQRIILKWHEAAMEEYLPEALKEMIACQPEDIIDLAYGKGIYTIDQLFAYNGLPYYDANGNLNEPVKNSADLEFYEKNTGNIMHVR